MMTLALKKIFLLTVEVCERIVLYKSSGAEIDQLQFAGSQIHHEVLVFDVPMHHAPSVTGQDRLHNLLEKVSRQLLLEHPLLGDQIEQVFGW